MGIGNGLGAGTMLTLGSDLAPADAAGPFLAGMALMQGGGRILGALLVGIVGDLVESLLKRDAEVKDTGALLPGMGGVLDRIDAHLLGIPTMYYMMLGYVYVQAG